MITLGAHGNGQARVWAGAFGYEWTVHVIASKDQAGLAIAFRIGVQLEVGWTSIDLGPVTTTSVVQLHPHDDSAFGWLSVVVPISDDQIQVIEAQRNGGPVRVRLQPNIDWSSSSIGGALGSIDFGISDQDASWWRSALAAWQWGTTTTIVVRRPLRDPNSDYDTAYSHLLDAQKALLTGNYRSVGKEVRAVFEVLNGTERPGEAKGQTRSVPERWWDVSALAKTMFDVSSGAAHTEAPVRDHPWTRTEAESMIAVASSLLNVAMAE